MAYGYLKRLAKKDEDIKLYLEENMVFEAFIMAIRNGHDDPDKVYEELEKEISLKGSRITEDEFDSLWLELVDHQETESYEYNGRICWRTVWK